MSHVTNLLKLKGHDVFTIRPDATVLDAIGVMAERDIGALLVMDDDRIVGLISERDYARNVVLKGRTSPETPVRDVMTTRVPYVRPENTVEECMAIMTEARVRHLPVMEDGRPISIVSIGDLVKSIIAEQQFIIDELILFIAGDR